MISAKKFEMINKRIANLKDAIDFVAGLSPQTAVTEFITAELMASIKRGQDTLTTMIETQNDGKPWTDEDLSVMREMLSGKTANTWNDGDNNLSLLSGALKRSPRLVEKKVKSTKYRKAIDYYYCAGQGIAKWE